MSITPFGLVFMTLGFTLLATRRTWLLPLLVVSAGLHAYAVAIIGPATQAVGLGISPWLFTCSLIFVHLVAKVARCRHIDFGANRDVRVLFFIWMIYAVWCVLSAFALPFVFEGLPVHALAKFDGFDTPTVPLAWNPINAVQALNVSIIGMVMLYILNIAKHSLIIPQLFAGFAASLALSVSLSAYQRFESIRQFSSDTLSLSETVRTIDFFQLSLNPSYRSGIQYFGTFLRLNWPFSEPSYASVWYSGFLVGGVALCLFARHIGVSFLFIVGGLIGLLNTMGASGLGGSAIGILVVFATALIFISRQTVNRTPIIKRIRTLAVLLGLLILGYQIVREYQPRLPDMLQLGSNIFHDRISRISGVRHSSNMTALTIARETWGLGVGLGSNRASSYVLSMLSSIGVPGVLLFSFLLSRQSLLMALNKGRSPDMVGIFILGGLAGVFPGMVLGIPDLNFPAWWIWIIAGFGVLASRANTLSRSTELPPPKADPLIEVVPIQN